MLIGVWGLARAGLKSPIYTENDLEVIRFITGFLSDAFMRSLIPPPVEEDSAYLDYQGHVVQSGVKIQEIFDRLFDRDDLGTVFRDGYRKFLHGHFTVGMDRVTLHAQNATYSFLFTLLRPGGIPMRLEGIPYAAVRLLDVVALDRVAHVLDWPALSGIYSLTVREDQVLAGIFRGNTNKMIAYRLGIDEGTVKYYTYKIFEKTGLHSRTELVLNLSPAKKPN
jgi:DNA-binding CsgD family transcriptional regulator